MRVLLPSVDNAGGQIQHDLVVDFDLEGYGGDDPPPV